MVASHLALNMNITVEGSMLFKLWPAWVVKREDFSETQNKLLLQSGMKNVWTLALDQEYVLSRLFKHYDVFPELYGSCGGLYMVEEVMALLKMYKYYRKHNENVQTFKLFKMFK